MSSVKNEIFSMGIKSKLTILISISIFSLVFMFLTLLLIAGKEQKETAIKNQLIAAIEENAQKIRFRNNIFVFNPIYFLQDNIYTSLYDEEKEFIYGEIPKNFPFYTDFTINTLKKTEHFYVYDIQKEVQGKKLFVRGVISIASARQTFSILFFTILAFLPLIALLTIVLARVFIDKSFKPIEHIIATAQEIQNKKNFSLRIGLPGKSHDEIHALAQTFDTLFEATEQAFIKEKQFTSNASHEIRTPVSVIIAQCELALETEQSRENQKALGTILWNAKKISQLTSQLLLLSKAEQNADILEREKINISELFEIIAEQQQEIAKEKGLDFSYSVENSIFFHGDPALLTSALINLFSNAIRYNKKHGKINFSLSQGKNFIHAKISDTGIGISEQDLPKIWERFYQADKARNKKEYIGFGLGLPLVKWIIEAHQGKISISSALGKGTIARFTLPKNI